jgi:hypothetical protein
MPVMSFPSGFQSEGTPVLIPSEQKTTDPGEYVTLFQMTNPANRILNSVKVSCRAEAKIEILQDNILIGSERTGPGSPNAKMNYELGFPLTTGVELLVRIIACEGTAPTDVEGYIEAEDLAE